VSREVCPVLRHGGLPTKGESWARKYQELVEGWVRKSYALLEFLSHPKAIRFYLYTTNRLERDGEAEQADRGGAGLCGLEKAVWLRGNRVGKLSRRPGSINETLSLRPP